MDLASILASIILPTLIAQASLASPTRPALLTPNQASFPPSSFSLLSPSLNGPRVAEMKDANYRDANYGDAKPSYDTNEEEAVKGSYSYSYSNLCEAFHSGSFVVDSGITGNGCKLQCVILTNSSEKKKEFFDRSLTVEHNLHDGIICKRDHICNNGSCVLELTSASAMNDVAPSRSQDKLGIVVIELIDAVVPKKDTITASDTYVKIEIKPTNDDKIPEAKTQENDGAKNLGANQDGVETLKVDTSKVIWDTNHPSFNATFKMEKVSIRSLITFAIYDKDMMGPNDFIGTVSISIRKVLERDLNHKEITFPILKTTDKYYLRVKISWIAYD